MHDNRLGALSRFTTITALLVLAGCGDTNSGSSAADTEADNDTAEVSTFDPADADSGIATADVGDNSDLADDATDAGSAYGSPCTDDDDCESSLCIVIAAGADEGICTLPCADDNDCDDGSDCVLITNDGQDGTRVCVPRDYCLDRDNDGYGEGPGCAGPDCDDANDTTYLGADELCDGIDNDCDEQVDDNTIASGQDCDTGLTGVCAEGITACDGGLPTCRQRADATVELCNGLDDDCDGEIDEDADNAPVWYRDNDSDRFGDSENTIRACARPDGYVDADGDCDDTRATSSPVGIEVCDGLDNDCDDAIDEGFEDDEIASCDGDPATGCETDLSSTADHCGACGVSCDEGVACVEGVCGCPEGQVECDGTCAAANACGGCDLLSNEPDTACGACGAWACDGDEAVTCVDPGTNACGGCGELANPASGSCGYCDTGAWECTSVDSSACVGATNALTDSNNCGACGVVCEDGRGCVDGSCNCPADQVRFTAQPSSQTLCTGLSVSFVAGVVGDGLTYQWQRNTGADWTDLTDAAGISGSGTPTLNIASITPAMNGHRFRLRASASCSSLTSEPATLTVNTAPTGVSANASPTLLCPGASLSLSASASNASSWSWSGPGGFSASTQNPTRTAVTAAHAGVYTVSASNACGSTEASTSAVSVTTPASIVGHPGNRTVCTGASTTFTVAGAGTSVNYRWQVSTNGGSTWTNINNGGAYAGATGTTLTVTTSTGMNNYRYRAVATGPCNSVNSNPATLTVNTAPTGVSAVASPNPVCATTTLSLNATASGATNWSWSGPGGYSSTAQNATRPAITTGHAGVYTVTASNVCGSANATTASVAVQTEPVVTSGPANRSVCSGTTTTFSVSGTGTSVSWRWQVSTNGGSTWSNINNGGAYSGATSTTLSVTTSSGMNGYRYRAQASGPCGSAGSGTATLSVVTCTPGQCGSANGGNTASAPTTGLCSAGSPSAVTGSGPYSWTCNGTGGAGNASCSSNRSCTATSRNWTVGGQTCSASLADRNHSGSLSVSDATTPTVGSASFTCNQGTWTQSAGATCTDVTADCPDESGGGVTTWYYQFADQGSDGYWYCVREYGSTEYGRCEDESYDVERINGPVAFCTSSSRSGECCDSYPGNVCSSDCTGTLCSPAPGWCNGNCNGTSYLRNCDVP